MQKLAKMSKGRIISTLEEASSDDLGHIDELREDRLSEESYVFVESKTSNVVSLIARGSTVEAMDEVKRALDDAVGDLTTFMRGRRIVAGAGACEVALLTQIARYSEELTGKEQLAVRAFSEALEIIPKTLAENAGLDPIDILASLKVEHNEGHEHKGIDVFDGSIIDAFDKGIVEPFQVKLEAVVSATELAIMILRIDDVITAQPTKAQEKQEEK
jgi:chaperonin GroEL (HSP60 family)